jgi:outer membrane protein assembly factor BamB
MDNFTKKVVAFVLIVACVASVSSYVYLKSTQQDSNAKAFSWKQSHVNGFDNFGTATYQDGLLFAPSKGNDQVFALDASNGAVIWQSSVRQCDASPCIDYDRIYVCECFGFDAYGRSRPTPNPRAMALNKTTGTKVWSFTEPNGYGWVGSPLVKDEYVYLTTFGGGFYALNKTSGEVLWHREDIGQIVCSAAYDEGVVFISSNSTASQYALNATDGETIWQVTYGASWDSSPVVYRGMVIQVTRDLATNVWSTNVMNETNGNLIRKFEGKGAPSTPLVQGDSIFIASNDRRMWAYDLLTGKELWHTVELHNGYPQEYSYSSPAASGGKIFYQSLSGVLYMIDEATGTVGWYCTLDGSGYGSPSLGNGYVYVTNDSALYAFRVDVATSDWPMFCQNVFHQSYSQ